jgi:hypothetical protein
MVDFNSQSPLRSLSKLLPALLLGAFLLSGCAAGVQTPASAGLYTSTQGPVAVGESDASSSKTGKASAQSILGIFATGDASIKKAAESAGISTIHHVDYQAKNYLGLYGKYTVVVYGE